VIAMICGAARELVVGDPAELATDVGPVIDAEAFAGIQQHLTRLRSEAQDVLESYKENMPQALIDKGLTAMNSMANLMAPQAFEVQHISDLKEEIFGPVLHIVRWGGDPLKVIAQINALGYGLTLGIQTRIDSRAQALAQPQPDWRGGGRAAVWWRGPERHRSQGGWAALSVPLLRRENRHHQHHRGGGQCAVDGLAQSIRQLWPAGAARQGGSLQGLHWAVRRYDFVA